MSKVCKSNLDTSDIARIAPHYKEDGFYIKKVLGKLIQNSSSQLYFRLSVVRDELSGIDPYFEYSYYMDLKGTDIASNAELINLLQKSANDGVLFTEEVEFTALEDISSEYRVYLVEVSDHYIYIHRMIHVRKIFDKEFYLDLLDFFNEAVSDDIAELYLDNQGFSLMDLNFIDITLWYEIQKMQTFFSNYCNCTAIVEAKKAAYDLRYAGRTRLSHFTENWAQRVEQIQEEGLRLFILFYNYCESRSKCEKVASDIDPAKLYQIFYSQLDSKRLKARPPEIRAWKSVMRRFSMKIIGDVTAAQKMFKKARLKDLTLDEISLASGNTVEDFLKKCGSFDLNILDYITEDIRLADYSFNLTRIWNDKTLSHYKLERIEDNGKRCCICGRRCCTLLTASDGGVVALHSKRCLDAYKAKAVINFR